MFTFWLGCLHTNTRTWFLHNFWALVVNQGSMLFASLVILSSEEIWAMGEDTGLFTIILRLFNESELIYH